MILKGFVQLNVPTPVTNREGNTDLKSQRVSEINVGASFGEAALTDKVLQPRTYTITCKEGCDLAILDRKQYHKILANAEKNYMTTHLSFFLEIPVMRPLSEYMLKSWLSMFEKKVYNVKHVLYKEGDQPQEVYLIRSGQVMCKKKILMPRKFEDSSVLVKNEQDNSFRLEEKDPIYQEIRIALLGPGEIFGEEEVFAQFKKAKESKDVETLSHRGYRIKKGVEGLDKMTSKEVKMLESIKTTRETTMIVSSFEAEIWSVPAKVTFPT